MFLLRLSRLGRLGPVGIALTAFQLWQRLSPQRRAAVRARMSELVTQARRRRTARTWREPRPSTASQVGAATASPEENPLNNPAAPAGESG
jgi:hypothetical protein